MRERVTEVQTVTKQLRIIFKAVQAHSKIVEKACGLSSAKLWMLYEVAESPGLKVSELASALLIHASTCSNMLDKLEERQLISRSRSTTDQRTVRLYITDAGKKLLGKAPSPPQGKISNALEHLDTTQLASLESGLSELINVLHIQDTEDVLSPISYE